MRAAAYDEIRRLVRDTDPEKPSRKVSTLGEAAMTVSAQRATDPRGLSSFIAGDLDVIVMKALGVFIHVDQAILGSYGALVPNIFFDCGLLLLW